MKNPTPSRWAQERKYGKGFDSLMDSGEWKGEEKIDNATKVLFVFLVVLFILGVLAANYYGIQIA